MTKAPAGVTDWSARGIWVSKLVAALVAIVVLVGGAAPALADGETVPAARPAAKRAKVVRRQDCAFPRYSIGAHCRYQASLAGRGEPPAAITCAQDEVDVQRDLSARWCALPAAVRRGCAARARSVVDRSYSVLNGCVDEAREPGGLPGLIPGRGLFR